MTDLGPFNYWELLVIIVGVSVLFAVMEVWFVHRRLRGGVREGHNFVLAPIFAVSGTIYAVLLAFTVISVREEFSVAQRNVSAEASALTTMYRQTIAMPNPERTELRALLWKYTKAVVGPEWALQRSGGTSQAARAAITDIYHTLGNQPQKVAASPIDQEFLGEMTVMASDRNARTLASQENMPWILWIGLLLGDFLVVTMGCFLYMGNPWLHAVQLSALASLIGVLLFSTIVLNQPFRGALGIKPDRFEHSLSVFKAIDRGG